MKKILIGLVFSVLSIASQSHSAVLAVWSSPFIPASIDIEPGYTGTTPNNIPIVVIHSATPYVEDFFVELNTPWATEWLNTARQAMLSNRKITILKDADVMPTKNFCTDWNTQGSCVTYKDFYAKKVMSLALVN